MASKATCSMQHCSLVSLPALPTRLRMDMLAMPNLALPGVRYRCLRLYRVYIPGYTAAIEAQCHRGIMLYLTASLQLITVMSLCLLLFVF